MRVAEGVYSIGQQQGRARARVPLRATAGAELTLVDTLFDADPRRACTRLHPAHRPVPQADLMQHRAYASAHRSHLGGLAALKRLAGATRPCPRVGGRHHRRRARPAQPVGVRSARPAVHLSVADSGSRSGARSTRRARSTELLREGDQVGPLEVMHIPGHTPGHLAFHWEQRSVALLLRQVQAPPECEPLVLSVCAPQHGRHKHANLRSNDDQLNLDRARSHRRRSKLGS